jgi:hypothetical protein
MKLMVDTSTQRVVYAVAGKDVVDFLFDLLTLPIATVVKLLASRDSMSTVGCIGDLRRSVELLDDQYICHADARAARPPLSIGRQASPAARRAEGAVVLYDRPQVHI